MKKYEAPNVGKICKIEVINVAHIDSFVFNTLAHTCQVTPLQGKSFTTINFTEETALLNVVPEGDDDGALPFRRLALEFQVPQVSASRVASLESWKRQMIVARATDVAGREFVIGTEMSPATLTYDYGIAETSKDLNAHKVIVTGYSAVGLLQSMVG
jgi:hypothetical protein